MSNRVTLFIATSLVAIGVSAAALSDDRAHAMGLRPLSFPGKPVSPALNLDSAKASDNYYGVKTDTLEALDFEYTQLAQNYDPTMQGGPLAAPMPAQVQSDLSGGPLAAPIPTGTAPANMPSNGAYYPQDSTMAPFPSLEGNSVNTAYSGSPYTSNRSGYYTPEAAAAQPSYTNYSNQNTAPQSSYQNQYQGSVYNGSANSYASPYNNSGYNASANYGGPNSLPAPQQKRSWWQKLGFGNIEVKNDGYARLGGASVWRENDNAAAGTEMEAKAEYLADIMVRSEISAITQGGLEYGVSLQLRGQRDPYHRGFSGATNIFGIGDCDRALAGCASVTVNGIERSVRGATSRLYTGADNDPAEYAIALEGAHLFLRSAYGDITLGRDDGAAALFSLNAPSTMPMARSANMRADYTGLDMTKTVNDASGFAEKITYVSPRLLGDSIGFGVQIGASYAPSTEACGVDYCVEGNDIADISSPIAPSLDDALEIGLAIDRTFNNGFGFEVVANYAAATEDSGIAEFDDLSAWGLGLKLSYDAFTFGTSYLNSNNGWAGDGSYSAYDAALTWQPNAWGVTASYGQSSDDLTTAEGRSALLGVSYDFDKFSLGTGVQYTDRSVPVYNGTAIESIDQKGTALFVEGGVKF